MNSDLVRDLTLPLDFDQFMASLRDSESAAPIVSARRFAAALRIDMQTLARLAHVHRNTLSRLAGCDTSQRRVPRSFIMGTRGASADEHGHVPFGRK